MTTTWHSTPIPNELYGKLQALSVETSQTLNEIILEALTACVDSKKTELLEHHRTRVTELEGELGLGSDGGTA